MRVRTYGDPALARKALPVRAMDKAVLRLAGSLVEMMHEHDGIGLAATQLGKELRMVALNVPQPRRQDGSLAHPLSPGEIELLPLMPLVLVNPEIVSFSPFEGVREEGCLSVPKIYAPVSRPVSVILRARVCEGAEIMLECAGLLGRAVQHEIDHLDGILFVQRVVPDELEKISKELEKLAKGKGGN